MNNIQVDSTPTASWYRLVLEAEEKASLQLSEGLESYLVFLLMRFMKNSEIAVNILALEFLNCLNQLTTTKHDRLRNIADQCLLFVGLFPGIVAKRNVTEDYYVQMGQSAYFLLSELHLNKQEYVKLYTELSSHFVQLRNVLRALGPKVEMVKPEKDKLVIQLKNAEGFFNLQNIKKDC